MRTHFSIIIPAWNEASRLEPTLRDVDQVLRSVNGTSEIIVVDDGSSDGTAQLCEQLSSQIAGLKCVRSEYNRGKGHAVRLGMRAAVGDVCVMCDADGSMPASELPVLWAPFANAGISVVIGSRYVNGGHSEGQPAWRRLWSRLCHAFEAVWVKDVQDIHSGYKAFRSTAAKELFLNGLMDGWSFDLEVLSKAQQQKMRIVEQPIRWRDAPRSRVRPMHDFFKIVREVIRWRSRGAPPCWR